MEILYSFGRFLLPHLPDDKNIEIIKPEDEISPQYYRIERAMSGPIIMEDRLFFEQIKEKAVVNEKIINTATANSLDKFELGIKKMIESLMIQRISDNDEIVTRYMDDIEFQETVFPLLAKEIYEKIVAER